MYEISQRFFFDSAHTLRRDIEAAGSRRVHGHTYYAEVFVRGEPQGQSGMVLDLGYVRREIEGLREKLDHHSSMKSRAWAFPRWKTSAPSSGRSCSPRCPACRP